MALINRIARLFTADIHAVLDQIEEPVMLLRHAIREMEEDCAAAAEHLRQSHQDIEALTGRGQELERVLGEISEELDICLDSGEEELARNLIKRQLQTQRLSKMLEGRRNTAQKQQLAQQKSLLDNQTTLESLRQKAELLAERKPGTNPDSSPVDELGWSPRELSVSANDVEVALLREKKIRGEKTRTENQGAAS